ncbi:MAG TPA: DUF5335 family protein [Pyrinomonadaceae bacterium]|jgi:hypothetical protein
MNEQIIRNNWKDYLNDFSRRNRMRPARLEILSDEMGASEQAQHLPLVGISYEEKGSDAGDALVSLGDEGAADDRHLIHAISQITSITARTGEDSREDALEITDADGTKTILIFEQPLQLPVEN